MIPRFTPREIEVLECLFAGMCDKQISTALQMSIRMAKKHVSEIGRKLGIDGKRWHIRVRIVYLLSQANPDFIHILGRGRMW